jgi:hypothetical protein
MRGPSPVLGKISQAIAMLEAEAPALSGLWPPTS